MSLRHWTDPSEDDEEEFFFGENDTLKERVCPVCTITYAVSRTLLDQRLKDGEDWFCPNGHKLHFPEARQKLEEEKRKKQDSIIQAYWNILVAEYPTLAEEIVQQALAKKASGSVV